MRRWVIFAIGLVAIIILAVVIWFVLPLVAVAGVSPFEDVWLRLALIVLLLAGFTIYHAVAYYRRGQAQKKIEASLTTAGDDTSDAKVLAEKMADALQTLKASSKSKGNFLYELPWYVIIGPPGAGKTTALLNSGLKFPLLGASGKASVAGAGGTRYCDWWFTEDAVFVDTAGRYTTHDSDAEADRRSWFSFLDLLRSNRPRQPINGVIVAIGIDELMRGNSQEVTAQANAVRRRLAELHERLKIDFPVYVMFTKADLIAGFAEFFGNYDENSRKQVWGATFQTANKLQNKVGETEGEVDVLVSRLLAEMPDRLQEEADPISRVRLFGFASQMAALKPAIAEFLTQVFEPTRYHQNAALRGFYFTSGTQEGTPIDTLLASMTGSFGLSRGAAPAYSGKEKGYFLANLLNKVILGEAGWVSTNAQAVRRSRALKIGAYGLTGLVTVAALAGWWNSYRLNEGLVGGTDAAAVEYAENAKDLLTDAPVGDTDFLKVLPHLDALAGFPAGAANADQTPRLEQGLGLSQWRRLRTSSDAAYRDGLNRLLRSRLVLHMENRLTDLQGKPDLLYEPLKVYMMLGGDPNVPVDPALIEGWMQADWEKLYPGEPNRAAREGLLKHLRAMMTLEPGTRQIIALNGELVKATQSALLQMPLADRAFALLKSTSGGSGIADWTLSGAAGPDAAMVFETAQGQSLDTVRIPAMFTYDGFYNLFLGRMAAVIDLLNRERWLLGEAGQDTSMNGQYETLGPDLLQRYDREFLTQWSDALSRIRIRNLAADAPEYPALQAAGGALSPLKLVVQSIASETRLTKARGEAPAGQNNAVTDAATKAATEALRQKLGGSLGSMTQIGLDAAKKAEGRGGEVTDAKPPGTVVEEQFRRYHELTEGKAGKTQIDILTDQLKGLHQSLVAEQTASNPAAARESTLKFMSAVSASASRLDQPFSGMLKAAMGDFEDKIVAERVSDLKGQLTGSVTRRCLDVTANRYPFSPGSKKDVPLTEFARLFGPGGTFDQFYRDRLAGLVDTSEQTWKWKQNSKLGQELSDDALTAFQNAARIRDAFFTGQGSAPNVRFAASMVSLSQQSPSVTLQVNGNRLESPYGVESRGDFEWPGNSPDGSASITMPEAAGSPSTLSFNGGWALHRLINAGAMKQSGNKISVRFVVGGREVSYQLTFDTLDNPFTLIQRLKFTCPQGL